MAFNNKLALGTIIYGTLFEYNNNFCFSFEDLHWVEGQNIENNTLQSKLNYFQYIFSHTTYSPYTNVTLGVPIIKTNYQKALEYTTNLPYNIYSIQSHFLHSKSGAIGANLLRESGARESGARESGARESGARESGARESGARESGARESGAIFKVKATIEADIYELYCNLNGREIFYNYAMIPSYKASVALNNEFRIIKENNNLDTLEESDDEEEFENIAIDKFVDLNKSLIMKCIYMPKFRKWYPQTILSTSKLTHQREIISLERKEQTRQQITFTN